MNVIIIIIVRNYEEMYYNYNYIRQFYFQLIIDYSCILSEKKL